MYYKSLPQQVHILDEDIYSIVCIKQVIEELGVGIPETSIIISDTELTLKSSIN